MLVIPVVSPGVLTILAVDSKKIEYQVRDT
jgi:hypothetical protein